jgi:hypothetical protein
MAKYGPAGVSEVVWVTTCAVPSAITTTEANAGVDLTSFVRTLPDVPRTGNTIDVAVLSSKFEARQVGTRGGDVATIEILRDNAADTAYTTFAEDSAGFLVIARQGLATAGTFEIGDIVDVFPATVLTLADGNPGRNDPDFAVVEFVLTADPERNQTIAA